MRDIIPPKSKDKDRGIMKETNGIKEAKDKLAEIYYGKSRQNKRLRKFFLGFFISFVFFIVFFSIGGKIPFLNQLFNLVKSSEIPPINFYPVKCEGTWENPENVVGLPEVSKQGSIEFFSTENSAIYKTGSEELYCSNFKEIPKLKDNQENNTDNKNTTDICGKDYQNCKISSAKIYLSFAIDDISKTENSYTISNQKNNNPQPSQNTISNLQDNPESSDLDTKIIIRYSIDNGQTWQSLAKITNLPLSNHLNNGYFSFDAPFIKDWDDIDNFLIMFEGTIGGDTKVSAYIDSAWIEIKAKEKSKKENEIKHRQVEKDVHLDKNAKHSCKIKDFYVNPLISGQNLTTELMLFGIKGKKQIIEIGSLPVGIDVLFQKNNDYIYTPVEGENRIVLNIVIYPDAQKGNFSIPIIYKSGNSTTVCQLNINNSE